MMLFRYAYRHNSLFRTLCIALITVIVIASALPVPMIANVVSGETAESVEIVETKTQFISRRTNEDSLIDRNIGDTEETHTFPISWLVQNKLTIVIQIVQTELYIKFSQLLH